MIIYGLMKFTEYIPHMYDKVMDIITLGSHSRVHGHISSEVKAGDKVLDIGCGTGSISIKCAEIGAQVWAVDAAPQMLSIFKRKLNGNPAKKTIRIIEVGAASIKSVLKDEKFDVIIMSLMLGELPKAIRQETLKIAMDLLKDDGRIIISDELWPDNFILSGLYYILYIIFFVPNFLLTRTMIKPVKNLKSDVEKYELKIMEKKKAFMGIISIWKVVKSSRVLKELG